MAERPNNLVVIENKAPNQQVIEQLEDLLDRAKNGEVVALAYVLMYENRTCSHGWSGFQGKFGPAMIGEMSILLHDATAMQVAADKGEIDGG